MKNKNKNIFYKKIFFLFSFFYWSLRSSSKRCPSSMILTDMNRNSVWYFANVISSFCVCILSFPLHRMRTELSITKHPFFIFSELMLVNNSVLHEDIHTQMCSMLFVGFILILCIPLFLILPLLLSFNGRENSISLPLVYFINPLILNRYYSFYWMPVWGRRWNRGRERKRKNLCKKKKEKRNML